MRKLDNNVKDYACPIILYLWSNYNQTWHDGTLGQSLLKAIKNLVTSLLGGKYDVIKLISNLSPKI